MVTLLDVPECLLSVIPMQVAEHHPMSLFALCATSRWLRNAVQSERGIWDLAWKSLSSKCPSVLQEMARAPVEMQSNSRALLCFLGDARCMLCAAASSHVYWPFAVRCCRKCLTDRTTSGQQLGLRFVLVKKPWRDLPYIGGKSYSSRLYWTGDVDRVVRRHYGASSLAEHDENVAKLVHQQRVAVIDYCMQSQGYLQRADLELSATFRSIASPMYYPRMDPTTFWRPASIAACIMKEVANEKARIVQEAAHRERIYEQLRSRASAVRTAESLWRARNRAEQGCACPLCPGSKVGRLFKKQGLADHISSVH